MPAVQGANRLNEIALQWHDLASRRLAYFIALYDSGRWKRYYTQESFTLRISDAIKAKKIWGELAGRAVAEDTAPRDDQLRPAA